MDLETLRRLFGLLSAIVIVSSFGALAWNARLLYYTFWCWYHYSRPGAKRATYDNATGRKQCNCHECRRRDTF